jgi:hypothetical protein
MSRRRMLRLAIVLAIAVAAAWFAWRTSEERRPKAEPCVPGREEVKDSSGNVTEIIRRTCREEQ